MKTFLLCLSCFTTSFLNAQIISVASGDWDTTATWSGGIIPVMSDSVVINGHNVNLNVTTEVGDLTIPSGTISGNGSLTVNNIFSWTGGSINGTGSIMVEGMSMFSGSSRQLTGYTLQLEGGCLWTTGTMGISNNGTLINAPGSTFTIDHINPMNMSNSGAGTGFFQNDGTLIKTGTGTLSLTSNLNFSSSGALTISNGKITCNNTSMSTHTGIFDIAAGTSFELNSSSHTFNGATTTGAGYVHVLTFGTLTAGANLSTFNKLQQSGGIISGSGDIEVLTEFLWQGGTLSGNGTLTVEGDLVMSGVSGKTVNTRTLLNEGSVTWTGGSFDLRSGGTFQNAIGATFTIDNESPLAISNNGAGTGFFQNTGTMIKTGSATLSMNSLINFTNSGTVTITNGKITCGNTGVSTYTGTFDIGAGSSFELNSSSHTFDGITTTGAGHVHVITFGVLTAGPNLCTFNKLQQSAGAITGIGDIDVSTEFLWQGGMLSGTGILTVGGNLVMSGVSSKTVSGKTLVNAGSAMWTAGALDLRSDGTLQNASGATFTVDPSSALSISNNSTGTGFFQNAGTMAKNGSATLTLSSAINFANTGALIISNGKITASNTGGSTHTGTFNIVAGSQFEVNSAATFNGVITSGAGYVHVLTFGTLTAGPDLCTFSNLQESAGTITGTGAINVSAEFLWQGGTLSGTGILTVEGDLVMSGTSGKTISTKTLVNAGSAMWTAGALDLRSDGTLQNALGATFTVDPSSALSISNNSTGTGFFQNAGTMAKNGSATLTLSSAINFANSGALIISNGKITASNTGGSTHTGTFNIAAGSQFEVNSAATFNGVITSGAGYVHVLTFGILTAGPNLCTINNLQESAGTITGIGAIDVSAEFLWQGGTLSGSGLMTVDGSAVLSGSSKTITAKTLILEGGTMWTAGGIAMNTGSVIRNSVGETFTLANTSAINLSNSSVTVSTFENLGLFSKSGTENLTVGNLVNFENAGELRGIGTISMSSGFINIGTLAPGLSPGILTMNNAQPLSASSGLQIEMQDGAGAGTGHDQLVRSGSLTLAGTLTVFEIGTVPDGIYTIVQLTSGTISGNFGATNLPPGYAIQVNSTNVLLAKNAPFPLTLISFNVRKAAINTVDLQWITTDEQNVSHFEIQRSDDANVFSTIGTVQALNTSKGGEYDYIDFSPHTSINYYRLRIVDFDGSAAFSLIRAVQFVREGNVLVYPTATSDYVTIETDEPINVGLFSPSGILLEQKQINARDILDMSTLPAGMYVLKYGDGQATTKIVKQ